MVQKAKARVKAYPVEKTVIRKKIKVEKARPVGNALAEFHSLIESRYQIATEVYKYQDSLTQEVIDRICERLRVAVTGVVNINGKPYKLEQEYIDFNIRFIACEILGDLALNGIQIANFKFHPDYCAECKRKLKVRK